ARALGGGPPRRYPRRLIDGPPGPVAYCRAIRPNHRPRPPLAHLERGTQVTDSLALRGGRHHFFAAISLSIALSSIASARSFLSFSFSSSSAFSRLASDTSSPPYLPFHL